MTDKINQIFNAKRNNFRISFRIFSNFECNANGSYGSIEYCWRMFGSCNPRLYISANFIPSPFVPTPHTDTGKETQPILPQMDISFAGLIIGGIFLVVSTISIIFSYARFINKYRRFPQTIQTDGIFNGYTDTE